MECETPCSSLLLSGKSKPFVLFIVFSSSTCSETAFEDEREMIAISRVEKNLEVHTRRFGGCSNCRREKLLFTTLRNVCRRSLALRESRWNSSRDSSKTKNCSLTILNISERKSFSSNCCANKLLHERDEKSVFQLSTIRDKSFYFLNYFSFFCVLNSDTRFSSRDLFNERFRVEWIGGARACSSWRASGTKRENVHDVIIWIARDLREKSAERERGKLIAFSFAVCWKYLQSCLRGECIHSKCLLCMFYVFGIKRKSRIYYSARRKEKVQRSDVKQ